MIEAAIRRQDKGLVALILKRASEDEVKRAAIFAVSSEAGTEMRECIEGFLPEGALRGVTDELKLTYRTLRNISPSKSASRTLGEARLAGWQGRCVAMYERLTIGVPFTHCGQRCRVLVGNLNEMFIDVQFADEVVNTGHTGWVADAYQDETYRGVVLKLRSPRGHLFVPGYYSNTNEEYVVALDDGTIALDYEDGSSDVAREADSFAEKAAEKSREYDSAWQAGNRFAEHLHEVRASHKKARILIRLVREQVPGSDERSTLKDQIGAIRAQITELLGEARRLRDGDGVGPELFGSFFTGDKELMAAFRDGAACY